MDCPTARPIVYYSFTVRYPSYIWAAPWDVPWDVVRMSLISWDVSRYTPWAVPWDCPWLSSYVRCDVHHSMGYIPYHIQCDGHRRSLIPWDVQRNISSHAHMGGRPSRGVSCISGDILSDCPWKVVHLLRNTPWNITSNAHGSRSSHGIPYIPWDVPWDESWDEPGWIMRWPMGVVHAVRRRIGHPGDKYTLWGIPWGIQWTSYGVSYICIWIIPYVGCRVSDGKP